MINYTPKYYTGKAIFDVSITFKNGSVKSIRSNKYKYDICKPDTTNKVESKIDDGQVTIYPLLFENERVEGFGLSVFVDFYEHLTIKDLDSYEYWVINFNEVQEVRTKTCKQVLPEEEEKDNG